MEEAHFFLFRLRSQPSGTGAGQHPSGMNEQPYKSAVQKLRYADEIGSRIRPYLFAHADDLAEEIREALDLSAWCFLDNLVRSWEGHVTACNRIGSFLTESFSSGYHAWCYSEWDAVRQLAVDAFDTDQRKNIFSRSLKTKVAIETMELADLYRWTNEETRLCQTPSSEPFHTRYRRDHLKLVHARLVGDNTDLEDRLAALYHHGDKELMHLRIEKMQLLRMSSDALRRQIADMTNLANQQFIKKYYFMKRYTGTMAINELLIYDNWHEYLAVYGQKAFPDLHLREEIVIQASMLGLINKGVEALSLRRRDLLDLIDSARHKTETLYLREIEPYYQHVTSCGVSTVMSVVGSKTLPHTVETEVSLWRSVGAPYNFPGGMASILLSHGYEVLYLLDRADHFILGRHPIADIETNEETRRTVQLYHRLHDQAVQEGLGFRPCAEVNSITLVRFLQDGHLCILGIHLPAAPEILHWVLIHGYDKTGGRDIRFAVMDPMGAMRTLTARDVDSLSDTYMGRRMLVTRKGLRRAVRPSSPDGH